MRISTAYLAGAGTVVAAIVGGVGGGLLIADMISPKSPKQGTELTQLERRMPPKPVQAAVAPSEPVPYLAVPQPTAPTTTTAAVVPAPAAAQAEQAQPREQAPPQKEAANSPSVPAPPVEASATRQPAASEPQPTAPAAQPARAQIAVSEDDARARAKDSDVKRATEKDADARQVTEKDVDVKRTTERRRTDRRQQWAEKRRYQQRPDRELREVEVERVIEEREPRRELTAEPARIEMPFIRLFGAE